MITYSSQVSIGRAPADVYPYIVERDKQALWSDVPMQPLTEGPFAVGSRIRVSFGRGPLHATIDLEFSALEPDRRVAFTTVSKGPILWDGEYRLEPTDAAGTRLSQSGHLKFRGWWRLLEPMVGAEIKSGEIKELEKLKAILEASPSPKA